MVLEDEILRPQTVVVATGGPFDTENGGERFRLRSRCLGSDFLSFRHGQPWFL